MSICCCLCARYVSHDRAQNQTQGRPAGAFRQLASPLCRKSTMRISPLLRGFVILPCPTTEAIDTLQRERVRERRRGEDEMARLKTFSETDSQPRVSFSARSPCALLCFILHLYCTRAFVHFLEKKADDGGEKSAPKQRRDTSSSSLPSDHSPRLSRWV